MEVRVLGYHVIHCDSRLLNLKKIHEFSIKEHVCYYD